MEANIQHFTDNGMELVYRQNPNQPMTRDTFIGLRCRGCGSARLVQCVTWTRFKNDPKHPWCSDCLYKGLGVDVDRPFLGTDFIDGEYIDREGFKEALVGYRSWDDLGGVLGNMGMGFVGGAAPAGTYNQAARFDFMCQTCDTPGNIQVRCLLKNPQTACKICSGRKKFMSASGIAAVSISAWFRDMGFDIIQAQLANAGFSKATVVKLRCHGCTYNSIYEMRNIVKKADGDGLVCAYCQKLREIEN